MTKKLLIKTVADIRALNSRHAVAFYLPPNWRGTVLDILRMDDASPADRLRVVLDEGWMPIEVMVSFAQWCADDAADAAKAAHASAAAAADVAAEAAAYAADVYADAANSAYFAAKANAAAAAADAYADAANSAYFAAKANAHAAKANAHAFAAADAYAAAAYSDAEAAACEKQVATLIRMLLEGAK